MALTFYYASGSPYTWRVWLALEHKHIAYDFKLLSFSAGDLKTPEYTAINPRQKVPAIVDDGFSLYESSAILEYLDEKYPTTPLLFPGDVKQRAIVRRIVRESDQNFAEAMEDLLVNVLFTKKERWSEDAIAKGRAALGKELAFWETLIRGDYLAGPLSGADYSLYPQLALCLRLDNKKPDLDVRGLVGPKIGAWMKRVEALPYFKKTWPPHWA
jgi:glutathione S-transferase